MKKEDLKIVFLGTPEFAVASLSQLVEGGYNVAAVVTMPDKPAGRGKHLRASAVKEYALSKGLPVLQPERLKDETFVDELRRINADLFVVIAFRMLPEVVWQMPRFGTFNLHASLLPQYRGAAPINWAIINGETRTGVTTFFLKHEIDTGDIIDREEIAIEPDDNAGTIHDKLMELGAELTLKTVNRILAGNLSSRPQDSGNEGAELLKPAPKIFKDTCKINWEKPATDIHNLVRGLSPYPGAWSELNVNGKGLGAMKIFATKVTGEKSGTPGEVKISDGKMLVATGNYDIELLELQAPGKKRMSAAEFLRGLHL